MDDHCENLSKVYKALCLSCLYITFILLSILLIYITELHLYYSINIATALYCAVVFVRSRASLQLLLCQCLPTSTGCLPGEKFSRPCPFQLSILFHPVLSSCCVKLNSCILISRSDLGFTYFPLSFLMAFVHNQ